MSELGIRARATGGPVTVGSSRPTTGVVRPGAAFLSAIVESSLDAIVSTTPDGAICQWNDGAERLFGYRRDEVLGRSDAILVPADRRAELERVRAALRRGESVGPFETVRVCKDGRRAFISQSVALVVDASGAVLGESSIARDITERKRELTAANEQLRQEVVERRRIEMLLATENRLLELIATGAGLETLLAAICEAVESLIPESRCAVRLSSSHAGPLDVPAAEPAAITGLDVFGSIAEAGIHPTLQSRRTILDGTAVASDPRLTEQGIGSCWLEPVVGQGGAIVGTLGVYCTSADTPDDDALSAGALAARLTAIVVERARSEERSRDQLAQLAHVARLATMGEMASGLAHELNQPLCAIVNFTEACVELVRRDGEQADQLPQALAEVARQAERAGQVIRRLREFVKRREPVRQPVDINALVREVVAFTGVEARQSDVRVRIKLARGVPRVYADSIQIEQVMVNLVRNACEAMREGAAQGKTILIETLRRRGAVEVAVCDAGPGIPPQTRQRLFEPFFTTKDDGMGMGLSISRSILEAHEGQIWATPNRKGGTTFHFTLPTAWRVSRGRRNSIRG